MNSADGRNFLKTWFYNNRRSDDHLKDVYMFGIYTGDSCCKVGEDLKSIGTIPNRYYGFDSFEGLPDEADGLHTHEDWTTGAFNSKKLFNTDNIDEIVNAIGSKFSKSAGKTIDLIRGFYCDSLTDELVIEKGMKPALFVDMDVDLYISTYQSMDWMARNGLIQNTVIYFDDWADAKEPYTFGESLALVEICDKYKYNYKQIHTYTEFGKMVQTVYLINY